MARTRRIRRKQKGGTRGGPGENTASRKVSTPHSRKVPMTPHYAELLQKIQLRQANASKGVSGIAPRTPAQIFENIERIKYKGTK